jgi:hypothetical protein
MSFYPMPRSFAALQAAEKLFRAVILSVAKDPCT